MSESHGLAPTLRDLLVETFAVVLGIVLGLGATAWVEARSERAHTRAVRAFIVGEVTANRDSVAASRDYHAGLMDSLYTRMGPDGTAPSVRLFSRGFIHPATTLSTAWDAAVATDALTAMDYDEVLAFSRVYAAQQRYGESSREGGRVIYAELLARGTPGLAENYRNLFSLIAASRYLETDLIREYDRALAAVRADSMQAPG
ncbi:MAG TPA: hypothetical protein VF594_07125 [Rubricoccaceae bacterium]